MRNQKKIYLDYATSFEWNPSSIHTLGVEAKKKLDIARTVLAEILSARPEEIVFTSGGTESNNLAILGWVKNFKNPHVVTTNIEHPSVLEVCKYLEKTKQAQVTYVSVEESGIVDWKKIKKAIKKNTVLVSVMYANNEIGTIQPIREIAKVIRQYRKNKPKTYNPESTTHPLFHTDAVQAVNYLDLDVNRLGVDLLTLSGSKLPTARGVGVLYKRKPVQLMSIFFGGKQELGLRPGTENLPGIMSFTEALVQTRKNKEKETKRLTTLRDYFLSKLKHSHILKNVGMLVNGDLKNRLPNNINITIPNIPSDLLVIELSARGVMASSQSACKTGDGKVSHVIKAINPNIHETDGFLRFSLGSTTTKADIDFTFKTLTQILTKLKKWYN